MTGTMKRTIVALLVVLGWAVHAAHAQLTIEITGGGANQIPLAVLQFANESQLPA